MAAWEMGPIDEVAEFLRSQTWVVLGRLFAKSNCRLDTAEPIVEPALPSSFSFCRMGSSHQESRGFVEG
jgi:hypothetical protein